MVSPLSLRRRAPLRLATLGLLTALAGCQYLAEEQPTRSQLQLKGSLPLRGLAQTASVRRNAEGQPLIETTTFHDALFALGYVHASERLAQMVELRLLAQGRLAEAYGASRLDTDRFMRAVDLRKAAQVAYTNASPRLKTFFEVYARGVNAYLYRAGERVELDGHDYRVDYWKPEDSALLYELLNFAQAVDLRKETAALALATQVSPERLAWLLPTYPDEPLPEEETAKLRGLNLRGQVPGLEALLEVQRRLAQQAPFGGPTGTAWAATPSHTRSGRSLLGVDKVSAFDGQSPFTLVTIRAPRFEAVGTTLPGLPLLLDGYNGNLAWAGTTLMGDSQDLYLERLQRQGGRLQVQSGGQWQPASQRVETFFVRGEKPRRETLYASPRGPLLNLALAPEADGYGLALRSGRLEADKSLDALFDLSRAKDVERAFELARDIRASDWNLMFADAQHIGWQVTGRYPNRRSGLGLLPAPGWDERYAWDGYADTMLHPYDQDPAQGWLGTANQRVVPRGYGMQLSSSWSGPERLERLAQLMNRSPRLDADAAIALQQDQTTTLAAKLKTQLAAPGFAAPLRQAIAALPAEQRRAAEEAQSRLLAFDGRLAASSAEAAVYEAFLQVLAEQTFAKALGGTESPAWRAFTTLSDTGYNPVVDHLLARDDSPYWGDAGLQANKPAVFARALAGAIDRCVAQLGNDRASWQWGRLHRLAGSASGGDVSTLDLTASHWGGDSKVWLAPELRLVVDFGLTEPLLASQAGTPGNGWARGQYQSLPLQPQNLERVYGRDRLLLIPQK
ncbi:acyl-homoserine lactone acylase subunit beta [Pseudomonas oryzihabitans]|nr:acyl-homoserine lactone acylase subunit beta [Pseudomonas psychrotolerans]KTT59550.1 acyl-homoserine lactone acylase subunit beta [Pseudomonas psychrotolerans]